MVEGVRREAEETAVTNRKGSSWKEGDSERKRVRQALQKSSLAHGWQQSRKMGKDTDEGMPKWKKEEPFSELRSGS